MARGDLQEAVASFAKAFPLYRETRPGAYATVLLSAARVRYELNQLTESEALANEALQISTVSRRPRERIAALVRLSEIASGRTDHEARRTHQVSALEIAERTQFDVQTQAVHFRLGWTLLAAGSGTEAERHFLRAHEIGMQRLRLADRGRRGARATGPSSMTARCARITNPSAYEEGIPQPSSVTT